MWIKRNRYALITILYSLKLLTFIQAGYTVGSTLRSEITKEPTSNTHGDNTQPTGALNESVVTEESVKYCTQKVQHDLLEGNHSVDKEKVCLQKEAKV